jgi:hypothetical protein
MLSRPSLEREVEQFDAVDEDEGERQGYFTPQSS